MSEHKLVDNHCEVTDLGIIARCTCGWTSGYRFSSSIANVAFQDHREEEDRDRE